MQIAGQEGTFSLVALPPSVSSQPTQHQQQAQSLQKNPKLPIPRYQPMRKKGTSEKVKSPTLAAKVTVAVNVAETAQSASSVMKNKTESKHPKITQVLKEEASEKVILIDPASADISVMSQLQENTVLYPGSHLERPPDVPERPTGTGLLPNLQFPTTAIKGSPGKYPEESQTAVRLCQSKPNSAHPQNSFAVLSPAIFSKAIQIIPSPLNGKLPILPYSKMKSTLVPAAKIANSSQEKKLLSHQAGHNSPTKHPSMSLETTESADHTQVPNSTPEPQVKTTLVPVQGTLQKAPSKKRGRKRKTIEDILAFEARKKRSLSFFRRRIPEKPVVSSSKQKEVDISKKYRSIRPKPLLLMETVPQLVSLPTTTSDSQEQELIVGHQLPATITSKVLDCPPPFQDTLHLRGTSHPRVFMGSRPVHRCPTCSRCFQFKHHLQSHINSHNNSRPYVCPVCRKAYAHSGSLSTHMKLHHSEVRPRRSFRCEFCQKAFGYVGVYFSHLREVHKVLLTVEPSISHHENESVEGWDAYYYCTVLHFHHYLLIIVLVFSPESTGQNQQKIRIMKILQNCKLSVAAAKLSLQPLLTWKCICSMCTRKKYKSDSAMTSSYGGVARLKMIWWNMLHTTGGNWKRSIIQWNVAAVMRSSSPSPSSRGTSNPIISAGMERTTGPCHHQIATEAWGSLQQVWPLTVCCAAKCWTPNMKYLSTGGVTTTVNSLICCGMPWAHTRGMKGWEGTWTLQIPVYIIQPNT